MGEIPAGWRVFGPGLLGCAALALATLFNTVNADLCELRHDIARLQESRAEYATAAELDDALAFPTVPVDDAPSESDAEPSTALLAMR